jgi:hypothetical protein
MQQLSRKLPWTLAQTQWPAQINPVLASPLVAGSLLTGIQLNAGTTVINHLLGRQMQGWLISDINGSAEIYRSAPLNSLTLTLTSSAEVEVSLWVF